MKKIEELANVIAPPARPIIRTSDEDWLSIFSYLGTRLPQAFVQFKKAYGEGWFSSISHPMSAGLAVLGDSGGTSFVSACIGRLSALRVVKEQHPKAVRLNLYCEPNGFLPWGATTNDCLLGWEVRGELVDNWRVMALRHSSRDHELHDMTMSVFLRRIIEGSLVSKLMPAGFPGKKGVNFTVAKYGPPSIDARAVPATRTTNSD